MTRGAPASLHGRAAGYSRRLGRPAPPGRRGRAWPGVVPRGDALTFGLELGHGYSQLVGVALDDLALGHAGPKQPVPLGRVLIGVLDSPRYGVLCFGRRQALLT